MRALESPGEGRCVVAKAAPAGSRVWSLCGGFVLGRLATAPAVCPVAPGGLAVKRVGASSASHPWGQGDAAFTLDCPGRYALAEVEGKVSLTLAATELPAEVVELLPTALRGERYADFVSVAGTLSATVASASQRACRRAPSTPPDSVSIGPDHVYQDWNVVQEALRTAKREAKASTSWQTEVDQGCDIVCR